MSQLTELSHRVRSEIMEDARREIELKKNLLAACQMIRDLRHQLDTIVNDGVDDGPEHSILYRLDIENGRKLLKDTEGYVNLIEVENEKI